MGKKIRKASDQGSVLNIAWVADKNAGTETGEKAEIFIQQLLPADAFIMTDKHPDVILFMSGGSERRAVSLIQPDRPVLLLSIDGNNSYAAATEVMAWMVGNNRFALLSDAAEALKTGLIDRWRNTIRAWNSIKGINTALLGTVSDWLVASEVPAERLQNLFGVTFKEISWNSLRDFSEQKPDEILMDRFSDQKVSGLPEASQVLSLLRQVVADHELSALAVECFNLVRTRKVTACLALAQLNDEGVTAACEGDLASMAGMVLLGAVANSPTWMANTTSISDNTLILSHCTAAFNLVSNCKLMTHFETDCSLATNGTITAPEVTLFRFSGLLDKAFIAEGKVISHPTLMNACRTQAAIELPLHSLSLLRAHPLGNHLVMAPGKYAELLRLACIYKGIEVIE